MYVPANELIVEVDESERVEQHILPGELERIPGSRSIRRLSSNAFAGHPNCSREIGFSSGPLSNAPTLDLYNCFHHDSWMLETCRERVLAKVYPCGCEFGDPRKIILAPLLTTQQSAQGPHSPTLGVHMLVMRVCTWTKPRGQSPDSMTTRLLKCSYMHRESCGARLRLKPASGSEWL